MIDEGAKSADLAIKELEEKIKQIYTEAAKDIDKKMEDFLQKYKVKESIYLEQVKSGEMTKNDFFAWQQGQVFQGRQWRAKKISIERVIANANKAALDMINGKAPEVFQDNANFMSYFMEVGARMDFGFGVYNTQTVAELLLNNPKLLPEWKIDEPKEYIWNEKKLNNAVVQGIIQGERFDQIATRVARGLSTQNNNLMRTFTQTAMAEAQNSGRLQSMRDAQDLGITVEKEWVATLDSHTRDSHADLDGESVPLDEEFSNGCMYPGDPGGAPAEVYNCRCTIVSNLKKYPAMFSRRDNETGKVVNKLGPDTVENLTYRDWKMVKGITQTAKMIDEKDSVAKTLQEIANMGHGSVDGGLPFKYKSFDSSFRKVVGDTKEEAANRGVTLSRDEQFVWRTQFADKTSDALRFTNVSAPEYFVQDYNMFIHELEKRGFETIRVKNSLKDLNVPYRGVNTLVRTPSGYVIEMQYHTPQSFDVKERINHKIYEEVRKMDPSDPRIPELNKQMIDNMNSIFTPPGIETIGKVNYDTNLTHNVTQYGKYW